MLVGWLRDGGGFGHQGEVGEEADGEAYEPGVIVEHFEGGDEEADEGDACAGGKRDDGPPIHAARIFVEAVALIEILSGEISFADDKIIANQDAGDGAEETGVADEPAENITAVVGHELPRLHDDAHDAGDEAAGAEADAAGGKI